MKTQKFDPAQPRNKKRPELLVAPTVSVKRPLLTRLEKLHTEAVEDLDTSYTDRFYRDREGHHFMYRVVRRSPTVAAGKTWTWLNPHHLLAVLPSMDPKVEKEADKAAVKEEKLNVPA